MPGDDSLRYWDSAENLPLKTLFLPPVFYDEELNAAAETLKSVMEPIGFVVLTAIMGGTLIVVSMPMFDMINMAGTPG